MIWHRKDDWVGSQVDDSFVMIHIATGQYIAMNSTAAAVWEVLEQPSDEDTIVAKLLEQFDVEPDQCRESVRRLMADFEQRELVGQN